MPPKKPKPPKPPKGGCAKWTPFSTSPLGGLGGLFFAATLERWYASSGRDLPWRHTRDAYAVWVSETILQQTRVAQGMDYYARFMSRFPTVEALAAAPSDEVMLAWQGLGYYSRARNMHAAAQKVVDEGGAFPTQYERLLRLPGIGPYTAAAVASLAGGEARAVVDGNVYRVLSRYKGIADPIDTTAGQKLFATLAQEMMDPHDPARYNQAIMDFGALVCTPRTPQCDACPLAERCVAHAERRVADYPLRERRTAPRERHLIYIYARAEGCVALRRRTAKDIWRGLYEFVRTDEPPKGLLPAVANYRHQLTHQTLLISLYVRDCKKADYTDVLWVEESRLGEYALPAALVKITHYIYAQE